MAVFTQQTTFVNGTTADGGQVNTEVVNLGTSVNNIVDAQIGSAANIAISKTALGTYTAWTDYVPVVYAADATTDMTNVIAKARYNQIGKQVTVWFAISLDAVSAFNAYMTLPINASYNTTEYPAGIGWNGTTIMAINIFTTTGRVHFAPYTATNFSGATITGTFSYEVA